MNKETKGLEDKLTAIERDYYTERNARRLSEEKLELLYSSTSWRITKPIRLFKLTAILVVDKLRTAIPIGKQKIGTAKISAFENYPFLFFYLASFKRFKNPYMSHIAEVNLHSREESQEPKVSIVIPTYGKLDLTLACIKSIWAHRCTNQYEIVVVDDAAPDGSSEFLSMIDGISTVINPTNLGFSGSCNAGAAESKGEFILFLNNDTEVHDDWLDALVETFSSHKNIGLAGSKLIYPSNQIQEAGGIIWSDGNGYNYGNMGDPARPEYNYLKDVDYCSAASVIVKKELFQKIGGFDLRYSPAYYEDVDLAFQIREHGYRVVYQPLSKITHFEGGTAGNDTSQGIKAYQLINREKFQTKWQEKLKEQYPPDPPNYLTCARQRFNKKSILVLDTCTPTPDQDAGSLVVLQTFAAYLELGYSVTFIPADNFLYMEGYTKQLQQLGVHCIYAPYQTSVQQHLADCGGFYDAVIMYRPEIAELFLANVRLSCPNAKVIFNTVDLHYLRLQRQAEIEDSQALRKESEEMKRREMYLMKNCDLTIILSQTEIALLKEEESLKDSALIFLPLIVDVPGRTSNFKSRENILFVGGYNHPPNVDAVLYFVREVMPILRKKKAGLIFQVLGSNPPQEIQNLASEDIQIVGFVPTLDDYFNKVRLSVVPLRFGAGMKGKVVSSLAYGLPVVSSTLGIEGSGILADEHVLVADDPALFASKIIQLYEDQILWERLSNSGVDFANKNFSKESVLEKLVAIVE